MRATNLLVTLWLIGVTVPQSDSAAQDIRIEAESGLLNGFSVLQAGFFSEEAATNAQIASPTATYAFPGDDGVYSVWTRFCDEDDGASSFELSGSAAGVFATWSGDHPSGATICNPTSLRVRQVAASVTLHAGEIITFACQRDPGEPCRVDYFEFTVVQDDVRIEAEGGSLDGFSLLTANFFSGAAATDGEVDNPVAIYTFPGQNGRYDVVVRFCDEDDGISSYKLSGSSAGVVAEWTGDQSAGSTWCTPTSLVSREVATSVALHQGETIKLTCQRDLGEPCRVDYFELTYVAPPLPAFPGALGFGAGASGARGHDAGVCVVTTLADGGPGSFRSCAEQEVPAYVTFAVSGYVDLLDEVDIGPNKTIECATAPGDGTVFRKARLHVFGDNVILRGCHVWPGSEPGGQSLDVRDAITVGNVNAVVHNAIVANNSLMFATDENGGTWYPVENVTFQHNIVAQSLEDGDSTSLGMLIGRGVARASVVENYIAFNCYRNPAVESLTEPVEVINNVAYCFGEHGVSLGNGTDVVPATAHVVGNRFKACSGASTPACSGSTPDEIKLRVGSVAYTVDNTMDDGAPATVDPDQSSVVSPDPLFTSTLDPIPSGEVVARVLANAGPAQRIFFESDVLGHYVNGTGEIIGAVSDLGGWPVLQGGTSSPDSDGDGMPDWWEVAHCGGPCAPTDDYDGDGYENIEEWFHSFYE